ncbi:hypothetical protein MHBO_001186 [Bonamia ostreae]|uniref:Core Histone H2A/H2B/H3 domain-containing protein n=1 Tax=Bonamia ostreae TaxID=126728 RepID=A0ABV2AI34_9EUKA
MVKKVAKKSIAKATTSSSTKPNPRKKNKHHERNFGNAVYKVLKEIHQDIGISRESMMIMNSLVLHNMDKVLTEASLLLKKENKRLLSFGDIQSAVKLVLPGELAKHAMNEGLKAVNKFKTSRNN